MHRRFDATLKHVKKSVIAMDVKPQQQSAFGKHEEATTQENLEELKPPVSLSKEFISWAFVFSRKQASTTNFLISLDLHVFSYVVSFLYFFASTRADFSYLFFNLPLRLRA